MLNPNDKSVKTCSGVVVGGSDGTEEVGGDFVNGWGHVVELAGYKSRGRAPIPSFVRALCVDVLVASLFAGARRLLAAGWRSLSDWPSETAGGAACVAGTEAAAPCGQGAHDSHRSRDHDDDDEEEEVVEESLRKSSPTGTSAGLSPYLGELISGGGGGGGGGGVMLQQQQQTPSRGREFLAEVEGSLLGQTPRSAFAVSVRVIDPSLCDPTVSGTHRVREDVDLNSPSRRHQDPAAGSVAFAGSPPSRSPSPGGGPPGPHRVPRAAAAASTPTSPAGSPAGSPGSPGGEEAGVGGAPTAPSAEGRPRLPARRGCGGVVVGGVGGVVGGRAVRSSTEQRMQQLRISGAQSPGARKRRRASGSDNDDEDDEGDADGGGGGGGGGERQKRARSDGEAEVKRAVVSPGPHLRDAVTASAGVGELPAPPLRPPLEGPTSPSSTTGRAASDDEAMTTTMPTMATVATVMGGGGVREEDGGAMAGSAVPDPPEDECCASPAASGSSDAALPPSASCESRSMSQAQQQQQQHQQNQQNQQQRCGGRVRSRAPPGMPKLVIPHGAAAVAAAFSFGPHGVGGGAGGGGGEAAAGGYPPEITVTPPTPTMLSPRCSVSQETKQRLKSAILSSQSAATVRRETLSQPALEPPDTSSLESSFESESDTDDELMDI
ncbi:unnamed protein product [Lampetra fluviatilis]